ncbi:LAMI_0E05534g1_1 [Lachancea mirantina]|uniref:LAMI_0E05534g1_1 n=1 Tax=Lachancea mirantina TaxID=1230905 RepID=A0A1G4JLH2_9SACH|nr:LAMI_0E05534g1_1 [Lachancea mirantina]
MTDQAPKSFSQIKHVILILSGKGGVGKSSVTTQMALTLASQGHKVGVLDIDLTGPSVPRFFGMEGKSIFQSERGWLPVVAYSDANQNALLKIMSLGFLLNDRGSSVVWRGPKKTSMIKQFVQDVVWGELDYLLIDTPPGTSDEHIAIAEELRFARTDGAVLVTTPQDISTADVKKEINFCKKANIKILGIIENMSGFVCPHCSECTNIFSKGGGLKLSETHEIDFLGAVPIDPSFVDMIEGQTEASQPLVTLYRASALHSIFSSIVEDLQTKDLTSGC